MVPNCGIVFGPHGRAGIHAVLPRIDPALPSKIKTLRYNSFSTMAPRLYNILPREMRIMYEGEDPLGQFKRELDGLLSTVPDQPTIQGLTRAAESNSLLHQVVQQRRLL